MNGSKMANQNNSNQSPGDTHGSTKSLNVDDEESTQLNTQSDDDQHAEIKDMVVGEKDSNPSPGASNDESTHSLNLEPEPKTWCCVLVGTKCKQILEAVPLLLANGSQLRAVFELDERNRYFISPRTWCCVLVSTKCKQILEDVPLLLANGSQLRAVFELDEKKSIFYSPSDTSYSIVSIIHIARVIHCNWMVFTK
ncbi:unnamed protein product [Mytilus edulis]|uniref:Uncharacterized protein n=1 Tax=Mytilus edulis TaxID=6550 RepID=A0A8S3RWU9_MYTED|nr:unnamed protein product [Mytilus edulis]